MGSAWKRPLVVGMGSTENEIQGGLPALIAETTERTLLELANATEADHAGRLSVAVINTESS